MKIIRMPYLPQIEKLPSEATIEMLTNHFILSKLGSPPAWIFCPTRNEEKTLGYDASIQGVKVGLIQYKSAYIKTRSGLSFGIDPTQHSTLLRLFPKCIKPYVFYCVATFESYNEVSTHFNANPPADYLKRCFFIDSQDIPPRCRTLTHSDTKGIQAVINRKGSKINNWDGNDFVSLFRLCDLGIFTSELSQQRNISTSAAAFGSHFSVLIWNRL